MSSDAHPANKTAHAAALAMERHAKPKLLRCFIQGVSV